MAWVTVMCIGVFTKDVHALLLEGHISFNINPNPSTDIYFPVYPLAQASAFEMIGHSLMFAILTYLLLINVRRLTISFIISLSFAIMTELLQPFFGRGADAYDLLADIIGISTVVFFCFIEKVLTRHSISSLEKN
jgi:VanZ family protein